MRLGVVQTGKRVLHASVLVLDIVHRGCDEGDEVVEHGK